MNTFVLIVLGIIMVLLIIEMVFMFKLAKLIATFLNRIMFIGDDKVRPNRMVSGRTSPQINKKTINGKKINVYDNEYQLLLFKDPYCSTCKDISNHLVELVPKLKRNVELVIIQKDTLVTEAEKHLNIIIDKKLFDDFLITSLPTLIVVGEEGMIVKVSDIIGSYNSFVEEISTFIKKVS
ncbi:thioredoxin-like domain-containing protein [Bacillus andreraoultii]|uniref:thioredoxin-like domain-containing protein n=1 Tax=Bacillus andreraoultii TaxID=1499685 RepID=UPI00053A3B03|nr:thioredoxin-like domain-containing protein [Bacillus andreraoultii]